MKTGKFSTNLDQLLSITVSAIQIMEYIGNIHLNYIPFLSKMISKLPLLTNKFQKCRGIIVPILSKTTRIAKD